jgi:ABC-2 type transport system permease protein
MNKILIIARNELKAYFESLTAYVFLILFLGISGFFTWFFGQDIFFMGEASLTVFFNVAYWTFLLYVPALTMNLISEEKRSGTFEMLVTKAISDQDVILGKFFAAWAMICITLFFTIPYYITVSQLGNIDHGGTIGGYFALLLIGGVYCAIGIFAGTITRNPLITLLVTLFIVLLFKLLFVTLYTQLEGFWARFFYHLSLQTHFDSLSRGVADTRSLLYLFSIIFAGLYSAWAVLSIRKLKK